MANFLDRLKDFDQKVATAEGMARNPKLDKAQQRRLSQYASGIRVCRTIAIQSNRPAYAREVREAEALAAKAEAERVATVHARLTTAPELDRYEQLARENKTLAYVYRRQHEYQIRQQIDQRARELSGLDPEPPKAA